MKLRYELKTEYSNLAIEKTTKKSDMIFITDQRDGECVGFMVHQIDEVIAILQKLKALT